MRAHQLAAALLLAQSGQCFGLKDIFEQFFEPVIDPLLETADRVDADVVMAAAHDRVGDSLGPVPAGASDVWEEVLRNVPDGADKLVQGMAAESRRRADRPPAAQNVREHEAEDSDKWLYRVEDDRFPEHALRITSPESLGVDKTKQYSGYLDVESDDTEKHLFFWFFESRSDPENDPVVLWLNGGPGCSSLTGLFFELGPASITDDLQVKHNPDSWNSNANVIFLDQPANTGFSYSDGTVSDSVTAAKDTYAFLELFFKQFPEYADGEFHVAGESYAGHYIPAIGSQIQAHPERSFNLSSLLIGNGLTDPLRQYDLYQPMACGKGGYPSVLDEDTCQSMEDSQPRCNALIERCYSSKSAWFCVPATVYCNNVMLGPYQQTGLNVYDIRESCSGDNGLCYPELDNIDKYLNQPAVKEALGAEVDNYQGCNFQTNADFVNHGDWMLPYQTSVSELLDEDIPILIYAGDKDFICNWLGNEAWSRQLPWSGHDEFLLKDLSPWTVKDTETGQVRNHEHFTFLRVYDAGHMVPFNQPPASLAMLNRWLSGDYAFE